MFCFLGDQYKPIRRPGGKSPPSWGGPVNFGGGKPCLKPQHSISYEEKLPGIYVVFSSTKSSHWQSDTRFLVLYLFYVNGEYAGSRQEARFIASKSLFSKFSYYSKVEWKFFNSRLGEGIYPSKEEAIAASEKLLAVILPILKREHWPDWPVANGK